MKTCALALLFSLSSLLFLSAQEQAPNRREFVIVAGDGRFTPDRLEVSQDDLVKVTLRSEGAAHSFVIDAYRIVKRAGAGQSIAFEFRADQAGTFDFYCNLTDCRARGTLVVRPRGGAFGARGRSHRPGERAAGSSLSGDGPSPSGGERDPGCP